MADRREWQEQNQKVIETFRANGGMEGRIILTTIGAKSGQERITPLVYTIDAGRIIIIASKGGAPTHPDWYYNLVANPIATVELGRERFQVRATAATGAERTRLYDQMAAQMPFFAEYQRGTTREIPLFILERLG
jgi:deazaflavin-dependent oxidoreductase (nitroreductase family)